MTAPEASNCNPPLDLRLSEGVRPLRAAYADPPYLGLSVSFYGDIHPNAAEYDDPEAHRRLIERLCDEYDCWALSLHPPTLKTMLNFCPDDVRVMPWVKGFASFKPGRKDAHPAWEPVIVRGGRKRDERLHCVRDWIQESMTLKRGFRGAKPERFCFWLFEVMNLWPEDEFHDLFYGSGAVTEAWEKWKTRTQPVQHGLFQGPNYDSPDRVSSAPCTDP